MYSILKKIPENSDRLVLGKIYEIKPINEEIYSRNHFILENKDLLWEVFQDDISLGFYGRNCFETLCEIRNRKIKEIL